VLKAISTRRAVRKRIGWISTDLTFAILRGDSASVRAIRRELDGLHRLDAWMTKARPSAKAARGAT